ncbi:hypothetical protein [Neptunomonas sp.]|uniref:hypothetical protein n=1 Tax=Neptunomonas TaxID=75687 RepID=UPI00351373F6
MPTNQNIISKTLTALLESNKASDKPEKISYRDCASEAVYYQQALARVVKDIDLRACTPQTQKDIEVLADHLHSLSQCFLSTSKPKTTIKVNYVDGVGVVFEEVNDE